MGQTVFCRRCMIPDFIKDKDGFLEQSLERIDVEEKVSESSYEERLHLCNVCGEYINGICRQCGCFVAVRAAYKRNSCPGIEKKWEEQL